MKALTLLIKTCPFGILIKIIIAVVTGAVLPFTIMLVQRLVDSVNIDVSNSFFFTALLGGLFLIEIICVNTDSFLTLWIKNKINIRFKEEIFKKCNKIHYCFFEISNINKDIQQILEKHVSATDAFINWIASCVRVTAIFIGLFNYLVMIQWWILVLILLTMIPVFF
jgi:hypothetical protein